MVKSMTGYGRCVETVGGREFTVELRSVNNRYLDCTVKLPRALSFAEETVKQAVKNTISRGKVDVFISMRSEGGSDAKVTLNAPLVEGAIAGYDAMRAAEGAALEKDLRSRGETILELVAQVEAGSAETVAAYRTRLENKLREVLASTSIDESRILTEAAIFADKVAVDEETVRLRSHLDQMNRMLSSGGAIGRKLDFLLQEMNRESNTIGSKCSDVRLARIVVEIKAELEKIREQTQNIE